MYKYKYKESLHTGSDGTKYKPANGILSVPFEIKAFKHLEIKEEIKNVTDTDEKIFNSEKDELVARAVELGCGAESSLKRNSIETLKKKIEEA